MDSCLTSCCGQGFVVRYLEPFNTIVFSACVTPPWCGQGLVVRYDLLKEKAGACQRNSQSLTPHPRDKLSGLTIFDTSVRGPANPAISPQRRGFRNLECTCYSSGVPKNVNMSRTCAASRGQAKSSFYRRSFEHPTSTNLRDGHLPPRPAKPTLRKKEE